LPTPIIDSIKQLDDAVYKNADKLLHVLNDAIKKDPDYYLRYEDQTSPQYFHQIDAMWFDKFIQLRPQAEKIRDSVRVFLGVHPQSNNSTPTPAKPKPTPKARETKQALGVSSSGADSPAIGSITQGSGSALSINQQGGITAGTINNFGTPLLPTATVTICATYPDAVAGEEFQSVVTFTTSSQLPRPWFALFFDGPVSDGNVGRVRGSYGYTHQRAEKLPNPENSFVFRTIAMELGGTSSWFPSDGPIRATVPSKSRVKLIKVLAGGGDDPDVALNVNLVFSCGQ
jgi:hypothetical protein